MKPDWQCEGIQLYCGDCLDILPTLADNSIDTVVTDPPYEIAFMSKKWDSTGISFQMSTWEAVFRVLKPGGMLLAFGGTRTHHRLMCAIEDASFSIRDCIMWLYGSGFPKSLDLSKAIDKAAQAERDARQWEGWGTALKPAYEPIVLAMKPCDGTFASNAVTHGVAGLWIDGVRIPANDIRSGGFGNGKRPWQSGSVGGNTQYIGSEQGRWPANVILDEEVAAMLDEQNGQNRPSRFFYCAKGKSNGHPTVKPLGIMEYLCRLTKTPTGGTVLDPFVGSGSTGVACVKAGREFIGIEQDREYFDIAVQRISRQVGNDQLSTTSTSVP